MASQMKKMKLNALQSKTLVLLQILARDEESSAPVEGTENVRITRLPHAHGNHMHVGEFVVSSKDASGLTNKSVWIALARKGLVQEGWEQEIQITPEGLAFSTGLESKFVEMSDH
ncbi:MAG: hypothetical protein NXI13_05395 [Proteobacteria bacterium]|nr:hypothetical protein [Pseudomonadota bacterium]